MDTDYFKFYGNYKHLFNPIRDNIPPDFEPLLKALDTGLDINVHADGDIDEQDTLLSLACDYYGEAFETEECRYIVDIVRFFLNHGYNVHSNEERNGINVLKAFDYSYLCDQYSVEAVKLLLNEGADTETCIYKDEDYTSVYDIAKAHDGDNRGIIEDYPNIANYYYALWQMMDYRNKGIDYRGVHHYSHILGKTINRVMVNGGFKKQKGYNGVERDTFDSLVFDCEGEHLVLSDGMCLIVDPNHGGDNMEDYQDCTDVFKEYIGCSIIDIIFYTEPINGSQCDLTYNCKFVLDRDKELLFSEDWKSGPRPNDFFIYPVTSEDKSND